MSSNVLTEAQREFLRNNHSAVMATLDASGWPHVVPVGCALIDGQLWSSGRQGRVRTRHLRDRPHATLTVLPLRTPQHPGHRPHRAPGHRGEWVSVFGSVTIRADDPVEDNLRLYCQIMGGPPERPDEYADVMLREKRLVYVLAPLRSYGPSWRRRVPPDLEEPQAQR
jgi:PPOX class probable F420-dependent enzyme